jgi:hypothetical protein
MKKPPTKYSNLIKVKRLRFSFSNGFETDLFRAIISLPKRRAQRKTNSTNKSKGRARILQKSALK